jgi:hypothetical protein
MTRTLRIQTDIPADHEVQITLPLDVPTGPAELEIVVRSGNGQESGTCADFLKSDFFGMWKDRDDIKDSTDFARSLRETAWTRR